MAPLEDSLTPLEVDRNRLHPEMVYVGFKHPMYAALVGLWKNTDEKTYAFHCPGHCLYLCARSFVLLLPRSSCSNYSFMLGRMQLDPALSGDMRGLLSVYEHPAPPLYVPRSCLSLLLFSLLLSRVTGSSWPSPIADLPPIKSLQVTSAAFSNPPMPDGFKCTVHLLPGCVLPPPILTGMLPCLWSLGASADICDTRCRV